MWEEIFGKKGLWKHFHFYSESINLMLLPFPVSLAPFISLNYTVILKAQEHSHNNSTIHKLWIPLQGIGKLLKTKNTNTFQPSTVQNYIKYNQKMA